MAVAALGAEVSGVSCALIVFGEDVLTVVHQGRV